MSTKKKQQKLMKSTRIIIKMLKLPKKNIKTEKKKERLGNKVKVMLCFNLYYDKNFR